MTSKKIFSSTDNITLEKPVSVLYRDLTIAPKSIFSHLAKTTFSAVFLDGKGAQNSLIDLIKDMGLKDNVAQVSYHLILNAFSRALTDMINEFKDLFVDEKTLETTQLEAAWQFELAVADLCIEINADFFSRPADVGFLDDIGSAVCFWLQSAGIEETAAISIYARVRQRFVYCLHHEWLAAPADYAILEDSFKSPFAQANSEQIAWQRYREWLIEQPRGRLFAETFGLDKVYVPLRGYFEVETQNESRSAENDSFEGDVSKRDFSKTDSSKTEKHVVDLHTEMHQWLRNFKDEQAVRIITGGPGSGKSTFAKLFAAEVAQQQPDIKTIFVPLQHFAIESDLVTAMEHFIKQEPFLSGSPLDNSLGEKRLLLIFDGLDELASHGKRAEEGARFFVDELVKKIEYGNQKGMRRQALVTSRDITAQSCATRFRSVGQYLQVLPYCLQEHEMDGFIDADNLLELDQRHVWWQNYGNAKNIEYNSLPKELATNSLQPITKEPLLNYLVALSYERKEIDFSKETTLNVIYEDLLKAVFDRKYAGGEHETVKNIEFDKFTMVLESIAIAVWHGHGRVASESSIAEYCAQRGLSGHLQEYKEGTQKGLNRLLTAFYFRESDKSSNEQRSFEFTHKSFGEYLIARCIFKELQWHHKQLQRWEADPRDGKDIISVLVEWARLCGPTAIDSYLNSFIKNEAQRKHIDAQALQKTLAYLLSHVIHNSLPMDKTGAGNFTQMLQQTRNAEETLMIMHSACAYETGIVSDVNLKTDTAFGTWLRRISPQNPGHQSSPLIESLNHLELDMCSLNGTNLFRSSLKGSSMAFARLDFAFLMSANLQHAKLEMAIFVGANLKRANLKRANLKRASLQEASLQEANLDSANLEGANLEGANLERANLERANLQQANLIGSNFEWTYLNRARVSTTQKQWIDPHKDTIEGYDEIIFVD